MKIVLESQKEFLQGQNQVALTNNNQGQSLNINMNFDALAEKLKEVGASFKQMVGVATGTVDSKGNMVGFAERGDFLSGLLEGFGLDGLAKSYTDKKDFQEKEAAFVKEFEEKNQNLPVTQETLREIAKETFRETRENITYDTTQLVQPMNEESVLEQAQQDNQKISFAEDTTNYLMELTDSAKTYYPFIQETSKDIKELKEFIINNWSDVGGGGLGFLPDIGGKKGKGGASRAPKGAAGKVSGAGKVISGAAGVLSKIAIPLTLGAAGFEIYGNEKSVDAGTMTREEATKENTKAAVGTGTGIGAGFAGAKMGAMLGAMTGPAAPIAVPVLGLLGGIAGFFGGDKLGRAITESAFETGNSNLGGTMDGFVDPEAYAFEPPMTLNNIPEITQQVQQSKQELDRVFRQIEANPVDQKITNNVSNQTTVINQRKEVAPGNPDPTFLRFTNRNASPR
jgi:hypothetical protein